MLFLYKQIYGTTNYEVLMVQNRSTQKERRLCLCTLESDAKEIVIALEFANKHDVI